ncbi:MAG: hypothetical protein OXE82_06785 [Rhodobacter sp.]|nr:hypothetical protein [Rhodobacter sp.]
MADLTASFFCKTCGADPAILFVTDPVSDDSIVSCKNCNREVGTWGDFNAKVTEGAKEWLLDEFRQNFKHTGFSKNH